MMRSSEEPRYTRGRPPVRARRAGVLIKLLLAVVGVGAVGGAVIAARQASSDDQAARAATMEIHTVARTSFDINTTANGELEARNQIEIRNRIDQQATIVEIIEEGKVVHKGDLLIKLNDDAIRTNINEELLRVESARAEFVQAQEAFEIQVSENESALRQAALKVELADLALKQWLQGEVESKKQENDLALDKAKRELERLRERYEQSRILHEQGFLATDDLKQDELRKIEAEAALAKAELAKSIYTEFQYPKDEKQKTSDLEEARAELARVERRNASQLATKRADLENRRRQLAIREERLAKLEQQLAACTMVAPSEGLVVYSTSMERGMWMGGEGPLQIGRQVWPNQLLIVLPDTSEMVAAVKVHESMAGRIRPGLPATVKVEAAGGATFTGRVMSIGVLAESSGRWMDPNLREYTVRIELDGVRGSGLKPSMRCEAEVNLGRVEDAMVVPVQAVFNEGMLRYTYIASGSGGAGKFVRRPVKVGRRSDRFVEVLAGLDEGERVLLRQAGAGEVMDRPWSEKELAAVGLKLSEDGNIIAVAGEGPRDNGGPSGPGARRGPAQRAGQPEAAQRPAAAAAPTEPAVKPADTEAPAATGDASTKTEPASDDPEPAQPATAATESLEEPEAGH